MKPTGIVRDSLFLRHEMGPYHPESPRRLEVIHEMIDHESKNLNIVEIAPRSATIEELTANHSPSYVAAIQGTAGRRKTYLDPDTSTCADSWDAASSAAGGLLRLVDVAFEGQTRNGFAFVRPPGHHAEWDKAMGFCLFNNIAVAARYALARHGAERVAIVDWDLHHGNGTQHSFYDDPRVLFISTHQYPHYPGTGSIGETGTGQGKGYTVNLPLSAGAGDVEYVAIFQRLVAPLLLRFRPGLILVSAGFDAHRLDPLGGMELSDQGYDRMLRILMDAAAQVCDGRLILTLEGGYNLDALRDSTAACLRALGNTDEGAALPEETDVSTMRPAAARTLRDALDALRTYWPDLPKI
jgi:acetoin utilization deacetylase AcuC-like enzyme